MPVRSSNSHVLRWPDRETVDHAVREWAAAMLQTHPEVVRVGYFGSYARGDWGVGSDLDLIVVVDDADEPFRQRSVAFDTLELPVPADLLVYTAEEWSALLEEGRPFALRLTEEAVWVHERTGTERNT